MMARRSSSFRMFIQYRLDRSPGFPRSSAGAGVSRTFLRPDTNSVFSRLSYGGTVFSIGRTVRPPEPGTRFVYQPFMPRATFSLYVMDSPRSFSRAE